MEYLDSCLCYLWFLSSVSYNFSVYSSFVSLGKLIPRYFILFVAMVNGIYSLICLSDFSLLGYRNASDFCVLILYPATLLNSLISFSNFLTVSLGFSMYSISFLALMAVFAYAWECSCLQKTDMESIQRSWCIRSLTYFPIVKEQKVLVSVPATFLQVWEREVEEGRERKRQRQTESQAGSRPGLE